MKRKPKSTILRSKWSQVSIYPHPGRSEFIVRWRQGSRKLKKHFSDGATAQAHAELILSELDAGREADTIFKLRDEVNRLRTIEDIAGVSIEVMFQEWSKLKEEAVPDAPEIPAHDIDGYLNSIGRVSGKHYRNVQTRLEKFVEQNDGLLAPASWLSQIPNPQTREHWRVTLKAYFDWLVREGKARRNPFSGVKKAEVPRRTPGILDPLALSSLLAVTPASLIPFISLGAFCGIRTAEIQRMTWSMVDLEHKEVRLPPTLTKCGIGRHVPIPDNAAEWLRPHVGEADAKVCRLANPHEVLAPVIKEAGLVVPHNALRHSACSYIMAQVRDPGVVADYLGNSPAVLKKHYLALVSSEQAKKWFDIRPSEGETQAP